MAHQQKTTNEYTVKEYADHASFVRERRSVSGIDLVLSALVQTIDINCIYTFYKSEVFRVFTGGNKGFLREICG